MAEAYDSDSASNIDESEVRCENLDNRDSNSELKFELYENFSNPALAGQGGLRSYETTKNGTVLYYADRPSDYSITVDRLLWVDGYESTTPDGKRGKEMTLVVLKIALFSDDSESKFKSFTAKIYFQDHVTGGDHEPFVEAWAPFRTRERWNPASVQHEVTDATEGGVTAGYEGFELSGTRRREKKMSWEQVAFEEGSSGEKISKTTGRRNGVKWAVKQNNVLKLGATPELWVAALLSRTSQQPYVVRFRLRSRGGGTEEVIKGAKRFFGTKPDETKAFSVTPWEGSICNGEGEHILKAIDLDNLGRLRGKWGTDLILPLGLDYQAAPPETSSTPAAETPALGEAPTHQPSEMRINQGGDKVAPQGSSAKAATHQHAPQPQPQQQAGRQHAASAHGSGAAPQPTPATQWHIPANPVRLAALEARVAQTEARVASLESTMFELREALFDIRITAQRPLP